MHANPATVGALAAEPAAVMLFPTTPLSTKHSRRRAPQESPGIVQSALVTHAWNRWIVHVVSVGPPAQTPSSVEPVSLGFAEQTPSSQPFGLVPAPGAAQAPPGHSEPAAHGVPAFVLPMQRRPPHVVAPTATQSASM
jgi:hypothetical protein